MSLLNLSGRVAIVTGGSRGIGFGIAKGFAEAGASIVIAAQNKQRMAIASEELKTLGAEVFTIKVDVADEDSVQSMVKAVIDRFKQIDILVANAGINNRKFPEDFSMKEWESIMNVNLTGAFLCARAVYPYMKEHGYGKIITIGSGTSLFGAPGMAPYAASKGGLVQLTKTLATAWAKDNIQVNSILPGWIDTDLTRESYEKDKSLYQKVAARTPQGRWGKPEDLAGVAILLASQGSDFITGSAFPVDGGFSALGGYSPR